MTRIAVFCSGGGTNLQALLDAQKAGAFPNGEIVLVLSTSPTAYALTRAEDHGISTVVMARREFESEEQRDQAILETLQEHDIDLIVLAGYLGIVGPKVLKAYPRSIINVHPSLIPSFSGKGFYGLKVHEEALKCGVKVTGATVHFVSEVIDGGEIILQKAVEVLPEDTPETLQRRVMEQAEWLLLPQAVAMFCSGEINGKRESNE